VIGPGRAPEPGSEPARSDADQVDQLAAALQEQIADLFANGGGGRNAELRRVRQRIANEAQELRRLAKRNPSALTTDVVALLRDVKRDATNGSNGLDHAWFVADSLKQLLLLLGDDAYIGMLLEQELVRSKNNKRLSWNRYLNSDELDELCKSYRRGDVTDSQRIRALESLSFLFDKRRDDGAHYRARVSMKGAAFWRAAALIGPLVIAVGVTTAVAGDVTVGSVALTAAAGALGSTLSGALKMRELITINDIRALYGWSFLQPLVGAAAGLAVLLLMESEIVTLPGVDGAASWAAIATYGFLAGFSEPFFLGVVGKIAGAAEQQP
jgi:hypothetical protein